jgi:hypothetical protein
MRWTFRIASTEQILILIYPSVVTLGTGTEKNVPILVIPNRKRSRAPVQHEKLFHYSNFLLEIGRNYEVYGGFLFSGLKLEC